MRAIAVYIWILIAGLSPEAHSARERGVAGIPVSLDPRAQRVVAPPQVNCNNLRPVPGQTHTRLPDGCAAPPAHAQKKPEQPRPMPQIPGGSGGGKAAADDSKKNDDPRCEEFGKVLNKSYEDFPDFKANYIAHRPIGKVSKVSDTCSEDEGKDSRKICCETTIKGQKQKVAIEKSSGSSGEKTASLAPGGMQ